MSTGTCTVHSWNDGAEDDEAEPKMGLRVDERLVADPELYRDSEERRPSNRAMRLRNLRGLRAYLPDR
jgi:WD repeat-containing protein 23